MGPLEFELGSREPPRLNPPHRDEEAKDLDYGIDKEDLGPNGSLASKGAAMFLLTLSTLANLGTAATMGSGAPPLGAAQLIGEPMDEATQIFGHFLANT